MATVAYIGEEKWGASILTEVSSWLAIVPTIFIAVGGRIQTDTAPVAFRFTAMAEGSLGRQLTRLVCSFIIILLISKRIRETLTACRRSKLLLVLPVIAIASVIWSQNPGHTLIDALNLLITTLFAIHLQLRYPSGRIISFLNIAAFIALLLCAGSVVAFPNVGIDAYQQGAWRGVFGQRNNCAAACTLFLVVALHTYPRGIIEKLIRSSVLLLSVLFIVMSGSRTGWLLAAIAVALTYGLRFTSRIRSLDRILFLLILIVPVCLSAVLVGSYFNQILSALDKDPTLTQRTIIWAQVVPSIEKRPWLGYGYSAFWMGLNGESMQTVLRTGWMEGQAQDGYLDILLQVGLLGLIPVVLLFLRGLGRAATLVRRNLLDASRSLAIVLLPLILLENIGESSLMLPLSLPWFFALIALANLESSRAHSEEV
jgi:exopolysaccharide production protein ExoQ